jgi:large repetitive protein
MTITHIKLRWSHGKMITKKTISALIVVFGLLSSLFLVACGTAEPGNQTQQAKPLSIDTTSLGSGQIGIVYSQTLKASGGNGNYTWSITEGNLPSGLTLKVSNGGISGTPSHDGSSNFIVQVSDGKDTVTKALSITIGSSLSPMFINTSSLDPSEIGAPYKRELTASGGSGKYSWSLVSGMLPDGLKIEPNGFIVGSPTKEGMYGFTVHVEDGSGNNSNQSLNLRIFPAPVISPNPKDWKTGVVGQDYFQIVSVIGGTEQINNMYSTWTIISGVLPEGLTIDNYGDISGKPLQEGTFNFTVKLVDKLGTVATKDLSITITK